ncbi:MAG: DUF6476 family protein [Pseudorhodobacter sp.]
MDQAPEEEVRLPPGLRFLKALVIVLTLTLIGGVITVVAVIVTRMPQATRPLPALPDAVRLPEGTTPRAITFGEGWLGVATSDDRLLVFAPDGRLLQEIALTRP